MKALGSMLSVVLVSLATVTFAQSGAQSSAQSSFDKLKALAGSWQGVVTTVPPDASVQGKPAQVSLRVTSLGNALMHEIRDDPTTRRPCCIWTGIACS